MAVKPAQIRLARLEAGLSLERVAAGVVSRQAVHQIENGRIRPSLEVLRRISDRIGRPLEEFLDTSEPVDLASRLHELERLYLFREFSAAVELAEALRTERGLDRAQTARVLLWLGASEVGLSRAADAIGHLRRAAALAEEAGEPWTVVEAMDWEACALHLTESPGAVALAESALVRCRSLQPSPPELESRILSHLGSFFVRAREWSRALAAYEAAVEIAAEVSDLRQLALMHHNLSITYQRLGNQAGATREAQRALALYGAQSNRADLARMQSDYGDLLRRQGRLPQAREQLNTALATFQSAADERGVGYTILTLAEVSIAEGDHDIARGHLDQVEKLAAEPDQRLLRACADQIQGRLAAAIGDYDAAERWFRSAIAGFAALDHKERAAETHLEYAELLEGRGQLTVAIEHMRLAARSAISPERGTGTAAEAVSG